MTAVVLLFSAACALLGVALVQLVIGQNPLLARARRLGVLRLSEARETVPLRQRGQSFLQAGLARAGLLRSDEARIAALLLAQAGWRHETALTALLAARIVLPLGFGASGWGLALGFGVHGFALALAVAGAIFLGSYAPTAYVRNSAIKRRAAIQRALPDALDLFVICAEAGLSLDMAMRRVAQEMTLATPELADELALTSVELGFLPKRSDALANWAARVPLPAVRGIVNILAQTERYGTPLAQSLRILAAEFRNGRMMAAEEKAARLPAILTIPMIVFVLPPLFIVLIGPAIIQVMAQ